MNLLAPLTGDFNNNGVVDAADYIIWRDTVGSTTDLRADANLNGVVDAADFDLWRSNFGTTGPASGTAMGIAAVPEPSQMLQIMALVTVALFSVRIEFARVGRDNSCRAVSNGEVVL